MFKKLYAICLLVEDLEKSLIFYRDTLGLEVNSVDDGYVDFKLGDTLYGIFQKDKTAVMFSGEHIGVGGGCVIAFPVEDVAKACIELTKRGIEIFEGPKTMPWGQTVAYFKDLDKNILEVTS